MLFEVIVTVLIVFLVLRSWVPVTIGVIVFALSLVILTLYVFVVLPRNLR